MIVVAQVGGGREFLRFRCRAEPRRELPRRCRLPCAAVARASALELLSIFIIFLHCSTGHLMLLRNFQCDSAVS
jgi:hypothetical protein